MVTIRVSFRYISFTESALKKKFNAIAYHYVRESKVMGESLYAYIASNKIFADILTKNLTGTKRANIVQAVMYYIT